MGRVGEGGRTGNGGGFLWEICYGSEWELTINFKCEFAEFEFWVMFSFDVLWYEQF